MRERPSDGRDAPAIGARLLLTRQALGLGQKEFAEKAGLAANTYNQYESGKNIPALDRAHAICDAYQLTLDWVYRGDPSGLRYHLADAIKALRSARG
jgi:transcriptional regulator with XRE-family HTH domain